jgi:glutaconate CoA-transferase, subunit A
MSGNGFRASKVVDLEIALARVHEGCALAVGGLWYHNTPAAAVRALIRLGVPGLELLTAPPSSFATDLLIGAGMVSRAYLPHVSFEHLGLAPNFRRAVQQNTFELVECDEATVLGGLMATIEGLPEHPITSLAGTDHLTASPLTRDGRSTDGRHHIAPPAIVPDVALIHAQQADAYGNVRCFGTAFCDPVLAKAARYVIVTVDELIDNAVVRSEPIRTTIPGYLVDAVVEVPYGAHPCSSHGRYAHDEDHLRSYLAAVRRGEFDRYLRDWVRAPVSHADYLERAGGVRRIDMLDLEVA